MKIFSLPQGLKATRAHTVNLRGDKIGAPVVLSGGALTFDLHAYAPASFILQ